MIDDDGNENRYLPLETEPLPILFDRKRYTFVVLHETGVEMEFSSMGGVREYIRWQKNTVRTKKRKIAVPVILVARNRASSIFYLIENAFFRGIHAGTGKPLWTANFRHGTLPCAVFRKDQIREAKEYVDAGMQLATASGRIEAMACQVPLPVTSYSVQKRGTAASFEERMNEAIDRVLQAHGIEEEESNSS